jgi:hypothetical protein
MGMADPKGHMKLDDFWAYVLITDGLFPVLPT